MFIAEHVEDNNLRFCSFEEDENKLRGLATDGNLVCPDCKALVRFRAGTKRPHFYHLRKCETPNSYSEPETGTHRMGKFVLYKWLKLLYPESRVELEYYLSETKQRSDVMILHPNGKRWAFEFQCSRITGYAWLERHELYRNAEVEDFWVLSSEILKIREEEIRLVGLESAIHTNTNRIQYLGPEQGMVSIIRDGSLSGGALFGATSFQSTLEAVSVREGNLWIKEFDDYERRKIAEERKWKEAEERIEQESQRRMKEEEEWIKEKTRRSQEYEEKKRIPLKDAYKAALQDRQQFRGRLTPSEQRLFDKLCRKHGFTDVNLPGVFHLELIHSNLILTPPQVWQFWLFNEIAGQYVYCLKKNKPARIWLDFTKERFIALRKEGFLRIAKNSGEEANYIFTMYNYIAILNECGILQQLGYMTSKYQNILVNRLPVFQSHQENILLKMHFEGRAHASIEEWSCQKKCSLKTPSFRNPITKPLLTLFFRDK